MKRATVLTSLLSGCLMVALFSSVAFSGDTPSSVKFTARPFIGIMSGYSKFVMDINVQWESGAIGSIKSELEFPLDATVAGIQCGIGSADHIHNDWAIELGYFTNLNDPSDPMLDLDWAYDPTPGSINGLFSYTESNVTLDATIFSVIARKSLHWRPGLVIGLEGEYRHQKFHQDILDLYGWYLDDTGTRVPQGYDGLALKYDVTYNTIAGGFYFILKSRSRFDLTGRLIGGITSASDSDDHVLRNRLATSDGTGPAVIGGLNTSYHFGATSGRIHPFIQGDAEFLSLSVKTHGRQYWYGDDPVTPENDTGSSFDDIPHHFTSRQYQFRFSLGVSF